MIGASRDPLESLFARLSIEVLKQAKGETTLRAPVGRAASDWSNPILPARVDPHVSLQPDGYYYLITSGADFCHIEGRRARTIATLSLALPVVLWRIPDSASRLGAVWAPELHVVDGTWFLYLAVGAGGDAPTSQLCVLQNRSVAPFRGKWESRGRIQTHADTLALDPTTFLHAGVRYLVWTQIEPGEAGSNIYVARMDSPQSITGTPVILCRPEQAWERRGYWVNEAPSVLMRSGKVFIAYTAGALVDERCLGLLVAEDQSDLLEARSWSKCPHPVFVGSVANGQLGPSHCSFTTTPDGSKDILVYQSCPVAGSGATNSGRVSIRAQAIAWHENGMPEFGEPVPDGLYSAVRDDYIA